MEPSDAPLTTLNARMVATGAHVEEGGLLAELAILEYFLHQSITLRLDNLVLRDSPELSTERLDNLRRAQYYSQLIHSIAWEGC